MLAIEIFSYDRSPSMQTIISVGGQIFILILSWRFFVMTEGVVVDIADIVVVSDDELSLSCGFLRPSVRPRTAHNDLFLI